MIIEQWTFIQTMTNTYHVLIPPTLSKFGERRELKVPLA